MDAARSFLHGVELRAGQGRGVSDEPNAAATDSVSERATAQARGPRKRRRRSSPPSYRWRLGRRACSPIPQSLRCSSVPGADDGRAELSRESRPKGGEKLDARRGPSWNGRSENDWEMRRWPRSTRSRRGRAPQSQTSAASHISFKDDGERGFDAASYDVAVWAGHGKGDQAGARRSLRIVSDPCDSCRTKHPAYLSDDLGAWCLNLSGGSRTLVWGRNERPPRAGMERGLPVAPAGLQANRAGRYSRVRGLAGTNRG